MVIEWEGLGRLPKDKREEKDGSRSKEEAR